MCPPLHRLALLTLALSLTGCWFRTVSVVAPRPLENLPFDASVFGRDATGMAAAAERLCGPFSSPEQRKLGFGLGQRAHALSPHHPGAAIALARCAAARAEWEQDPKALDEIAEAGMQAARTAGAPDKDPRACYFMAVNLGLAIQQRGYSALPLLPVEVAALKTAQATPELELGGPLRALGMLYLKAPPWPAGPGDVDAALDLLKQAVDTFPSHPLNHLFYAMALRESGEGEAASAALKRASELARPELWGDYAAKWQADIQAAAK